MKIHVVQENETLWTISQKYGVSLDSIIAANTQLANPDMIMPGMKITIPGNTGSKKQQDVPKKQQQAQPQPQLPAQPPKKDKKQWLPDIKEDDDKKWEALKKEMPSLPLTFHTKESMMPAKTMDYDKDTNLQKQQAYMKPTPEMKEPKDLKTPKDFKTPKDLKDPKDKKADMLPTPKAPTFTQPVADTPIQPQTQQPPIQPQQPQQLPMQQQPQMQPQLPQHPTVHQPVYEPDWCGQQPMWQPTQHQPCPQPYHSMDTAHMMPYHGTHPHYGHMPQGFTPNQQGWGQTPTYGIQQNMQSFQSQPNLPGQMHSFGGMNSMQLPIGMNQPNVQQSFNSMPNRNDCGCGE